MLNVYYIPIYSPASGKIIQKQNVKYADNGDTLIHISIFLDAFDDHVQYAPTFGKIIKQDYIPGKKIPAFFTSASRNEQLITQLYNPYVGQMYIKQIAGILYRRILTYIRTSEHVKTKQPIGKILFGSRVDIYLPSNNFIFTDIVKTGKIIYGGKSIIGYYKVII